MSNFDNICIEEVNNKKNIRMDKKQRECIKSLPMKEKFFALLSDEMGVSVDEAYKIDGKSIMDCTFDKDLGLDSLSFYNICYECQDIFVIKDDVTIEGKQTVRDLWNLVQKYAKGD